MKSFYTFFLLLVSFFAISCRASSEFSLNFDTEEDAKQRQELADFVNEALKDYENFQMASPTSVDHSRSPVTESAVDQPGVIEYPQIPPSIIEYPQVPCAFNPIQQALFSVILESTPHIRCPDTYLVNTMQDLRYIAVVLKPRLGTLINFFRFEFDFEAIAKDRVTRQDYIDYENFRNRL